MIINYPKDEEIERTSKVIELFKIRNCEELTKLFEKWCNFTDISVGEIYKSIN